MAQQDRVPPPGEPGGGPAHPAHRPVVDPKPLGFLALAAASLIAAGHDLGWIADAERVQIGIMLLVAAPVVQLLASTMGFVAREPVPATGMALLGAGWAARGLTWITMPAGSYSAALGTLLIIVGAAALLSAAEALVRGSAVAAVVLALAALNFLLTAASELAASATVADLAGAVGLAVTAAALAAAATVLQRQ